MKPECQKCMGIMSKFVKSRRDHKLAHIYLQIEMGIFCHLKTSGNSFGILGIMHGHSNHQTDSSAEVNILKEASSSKHFLHCF